MMAQAMLSMILHVVVTDYRTEWSKQTVVEVNRTCAEGWPQDYCACIVPKMKRLLSEEDFKKARYVQHVAKHVVLATFQAESECSKEMGVIESEDPLDYGEEPRSSTLRVTLRQ